MVNQDKLTDLFTYHPPLTDEDRKKHEVVNEASLQYARALAEVITDPAELTTILRQIQQTRMLANAAVSQDRVGSSYRSLFA